jgi:hypothetical protein
LPGKGKKMERERGRGFDFDAAWSIGPRSTAWDALWARLLSKALLDDKGHDRPKTDDNND